MGARQAPVPGAGAAVRSAVFSVRNLRLRTFIGFNPEERTKQQDVVINIEVAYEPGAGVFADRTEDTLDYKVITKQVIETVETGRFLLLEKLAADVLAICSNDPRIRRARVCIDKPNALRFAESVALTMEYHAGEPVRRLENMR